MSEKIIVTGASGFIGTNLLEYYIEKGFTVLNIDINPPKIKERKELWKKIDITDFDSLKLVVEDFAPDYIVHLAARTDLDGKSIMDYSANTIGVENLLKIASCCKKLKKIIITSSMLVCHTGYQPKNQFDYSPTTFYGESKVETEKIVWQNKPICDWAIIRPTSIWGPWFGIPYRNFFDMVKARHYFHIGHKSCTKTYGYVGNAIYQIDKILFSPTLDENNKVFYIGDNPPIPIEAWANEIAAELGNKIIRVPYWLVRCAALCGDFLKIFHIHFPMTSFRLKNMVTNNIINLTNTYEIAKTPPFSRIDGVKASLEWMKINETNHNHSLLQ